MSRNKALAEFITNPRIRVNNNWTFKEGVASANKVPTTLLSHQYPVEASLFIANNMKGKWAKQTELDPIEHLFTDTVRMMARHENEETLLRIDPSKWSLRRLQEEHDKYSKLAYKATYSSDQFKWIKDVPIGPFSYKGYEVIPLFNAYDIGLEGSAMNHCVGSYADLSKRGDYLVFSVRKDGLRHSTIGMRMELEYKKAYKKQPLTKWDPDAKHGEFEVIDVLHSVNVKFNQQYKRYNKMLDMDDPANEIPGFIERMLNAQNPSVVYSINNDTIRNLDGL